LNTGGKLRMRTINGIVIKQRSVGDNDKYIDVLSNEGIIEISVKGVKKINSKNSCPSQLFAYSRFCINDRYRKNILNSAEPIHIFYGLRNSLEKLSLASYFADLLRYCVTEENQNGNIMRLFLNSLYFMEKNLKSCSFLKPLFELRLVSETGMMPDVLACHICGAFEPDIFYFNIRGGNFCCEECYHNFPDDKNSLKGNSALLRAVRHIVLSDFERLFGFRVSDETLSALSYLSEQYIISHFERSFSTLEFYKSIKGYELI